MRDRSSRSLEFVRRSQERRDRESDWLRQHAVVDGAASKVRRRPEGPDLRNRKSTPSTAAPDGREGDDERETALSPLGQCFQRSRATGRTRREESMKVGGRKKRELRKAA